MQNHTSKKYFVLNSSLKVMMIISHPIPNFDIYLLILDIIDT